MPLSSCMIRVYLKAKQKPVTMPTRCTETHCICCNEFISKPVCWTLFDSCAHTLKGSRVRAFSWLDVTWGNSITQTSKWTLQLKKPSSVWLLSDGRLTDIQGTKKVSFVLLKVRLYVVMKQTLFCMLCSLGVVFRTSDPAIAAIVAVHTICGTLMSGGQAEGGGSQSAADLGLSSACKCFNKRTRAGVFVEINQFSSWTGNTLEVCSPLTRVFHFFEWCFQIIVRSGGFLCDVLHNINQQLLQIWKQLSTLLKCHK